MVKWSKLPKSRHIISKKAWIGAVRDKYRPSFKDTAKALFHSPTGKEWLKKCMESIAGTPADVPFYQAIRDVNLHERFEGLKRNGDSHSKTKIHPDAIDFGMGEQNDGGANELRGAIVKKTTHSADVWQPPGHLYLNKNWTIGDPRIFELVEAAKLNGGPLAEAYDSRKKTTSTSSGRAATFVVDYMIALALAADSTSHQK